ncbi:uncharacterized protein LOC142814557 [Rhipicephalus microplus]|uniref:uncharacterized protein LOC142814557 n=1 Tax=Rhipicephalus microplus TaxID=6941 RepID=UPI003F6BE607
MNVWITLLALIVTLQTGIPQNASGAHHKLARRQAVRQPRPGFRLVRARVRSTTSTTTASPDDYYYYEVPEEHTPPPTRPPTRGRGRVVTRFRGRGQQRPAPSPIPPPPSYEEELAHYGYSFGPPKQSSSTTTTTTTTTTTPAPTDPPKTLSPNYRERADGRIIDFRADPNFPRELKGADLTDYPFYENVPDDITFDCSKWHDGFYASIPHKCQLFHYCFGGFRYDFLCPNYTLYDQTTFTCRFINTVECEKSEKHYDRNEALYKETTTVPPSTVPPRPPPPPRKKPSPPKKKTSTTTTTTTEAPDDYDEYEYEEDDTTTTTTTTTTAKPKRRRLRPRLRVPGSRGPQDGKK